MKVFISSVVRGLEHFRDAAARSASVLGHEVKRSEDFSASAETPEQACLAGVRWADVVILLLGARYGDPQPSGISATHEEYREAKARCPVLAFVQQGVDREDSQQELINEVRGWAGGILTGEFRSPEELDAAVTRSLHELELSQQTGPPDEKEMVERARSLVPDRYGLQGATLCVVTTGGPRQQILRPSEIEESRLERDLHREALLGDHAVLDSTQGVEARLDGGALVLEQPRGSLLVDPFGSVRIMRPAADPGGVSIPALIEEEIRDALTASFRLTAWILDRVDPVRRLTHAAPVVALLSASYLGWRTREEQERNPHSIQIPSVGDVVVVELTPAARPRAALTHELQEIIDDFLTLLRRSYRA